MGEGGVTEVVPPLLTFHQVESVAELARRLRLVPLWRTAEPLPALAAVVVAPLIENVVPRLPSRRKTAERR